MQGVLHMNLKRLTRLSVFTVIALTIFILESAIPNPVPIPGIKLGLSNIVTLFLLLNFTPADAFFVLLARILLSAFFSGQAVSLIYSLCGGLLCFAVMCLINRFLSGHLIFITSIFGALFHNAGQIAAAFLITRSSGILTYLPFLILSGAITGLFTGLCAHYAQKYLLPQMKRQ